MIKMIIMTMMMKRIIIIPLTSAIIIHIPGYHDLAWPDLNGS